MKINDKLIEDIKREKTIKKNNLFDIIYNYYDVGKVYAYRIISELIKNGYLIKLDSDTYTTEKKQVFSYSLSDESIKSVLDEFDEYSIWDTNIINKWLNHLLNSVITIVEVDKDFMFMAYDALKEAGYDHILVNPNKDEYQKYFNNQMIVIKPLVKSLVEKSHNISVERLIVEIYSNKILNTLYSDVEMINIINDIFKTYSVDLNKLYHIAKRKKKYEELSSFLLRNIDKEYLYHD